MTYKITTEHTVEASNLEDAARLFARFLTDVARRLSETPTQTKLEFNADHGWLKIEPQED